MYFLDGGFEVHISENFMEEGNAHDFGEGESRPWTGVSSFWPKGAFPNPEVRERGYYQAQK